MTTHTDDIRNKLRFTNLGTVMLGSTYTAKTRINITSQTGLYYDPHRDEFRAWTQSSDLVIFAPSEVIEIVTEPYGTVITLK